MRLKDPSFAFTLIKKKVYKNLSNFSPSMPDGFFWEFNARAIYKGFKIKEIGIQHKKENTATQKFFIFINYLQ